MSNTAAVLAEAWADRAEAAADTLRGEAAPGLFRPEYLDRVRADLRRADKQYRFWTAAQYREAMARR